ncbi:AAA family ATPase, partial [Streptomyces sp. NPDC057654]|uniref:ATP-dependent DNA helicase n=1 Tax=Streptomyces sp. NPDC057654 TaxID=3346196 RepID=UPI003686B69A
GISSRTLASWLTGIRSGGRGLTGVDVLVVDEAAMCDDRDIAELLAHAAKTGTKIVGIGDPKQLHSPGIGGSFAAIHHIVGGLELTENFRQKDAIERRALALWRDDNRMEALRSFAGTGRVHALADKDETLAAMLTVWADKRAAHTDDHTAVQQLLMLAATNETVEELNLGARALRKASGDLIGPEHTYALPGGGELVLSVGDQVFLRTNDYRAKRTHGENEDVLNGFRGLVRAVDEQRRVLVEWREKTADGHRDVSEWVDTDYIAQGGLSLGYAITGHKSQGLSVQEALVYGPGAQANALYTMMSRDKAESHLFLPLSVYEADTDRARHGEPANEQEQLDRAVAGLIREVANGTEERMILTELPDNAVPVHVRDIVPDLPVPRVPGYDDPNTEEGSDATTPTVARGRAATPYPSAVATDDAMPLRGTAPYAHLGNSALRDAVRRAATATRAAQRAAESAGAKAARAEQQAVAGSGPNALALQRRYQDLTQRTEAIIELRSVTTAIADGSNEQRRTDQRLHDLDQRLEAVGRFGRPVLRGEDRAQAEAERDALREQSSRESEELAALRTYLQELAPAAGPVEEHDQVLAEAVFLKDGMSELLRRAQGKDNGLAVTLRTEATAARTAEQAASHREAGLRSEVKRRKDLPEPQQTEAGIRPKTIQRQSTARGPYAGPYGGADEAENESVAGPPSASPRPD